MTLRKGSVYIAWSVLLISGIILVTTLLTPDSTSLHPITETGSYIQKASLTSRSTATFGGKTLLTVNTSETKNCQGNLALDEKALLSLPQQTFKTHHTWSKRADQFSGPLLADVLNMACKHADKLKLTALNNYSIETAFTKIRSFNPIVALSVNGERLSIRDKGPLWIMIPLDQYSEIPARSMDDIFIWQLSDISILSRHEAP